MCRWLLCCAVVVTVTGAVTGAGADTGAAADTQASESEQEPVVVSPFGEFRGVYNETRRGRRFEAYRGIKYALPPVGDLRFRPPVQIVNYTSPVDARANGPACPQPTSPGYYIDEDCLTINVYTPDRTERNGSLPVIVFIHAGGYYSMTGRSDLHGPDYLLDRDVVLVTINYRLATLGFLAMGNELAPGNNGLKDQVAALRWVRRNIVAFGGDRDLVTLAGCSAGAASVMLHMISPMSKGLFHRAIALSGSPTHKSASPTHLYGLALRQAELVGCPTDLPRRIFDCLKTVPWRKLGWSLNGFYEFGYDPVTLWEPVVEEDFGQERFLTMDPADAIRAGHMQNVPFIISRTEDEFFWKAFTILRNETLLSRLSSNWEDLAPVSFVLPRSSGHYASQRLREEYHLETLTNDSATARNLGRLYADAIESFHIYRMSRLAGRHARAPLWESLFSYVGNYSHYLSPDTRRPLGAAHHDDLIYLFYLAYRFPRVGLAGRDADMLHTMTTIWYNFARYGDPNGGGAPSLGVHWPPVTAEARPYLRLDTRLSLHYDLFRHGARIWDELYPIQY